MSQRLAITGVGMITSLGGNAVASAAALRAGIHRPKPLNLSVYDPEELGDAKIFGHPITGVTDGFEGVGLYTLLVRHAVLDAMESAKLETASPSFWKQTGFYLALHPYRSKAFSFVDEIFDEDLFPAIGRACRLTGPRAVEKIVRAGHAGVLAAIDAAAEELTKGKIKRALVVGVDSLLREAELSWLLAAGRIKTPDDPTGLMPGEGAGALWLEWDTDAKPRGAAPLALLEAVAVDKNKNARSDGKPGDAAALARAIKRCLGTRSGVAAVYHDLNGETDRAAEWGLTLGKLQPKISLPSAPTLPATCLGDTGAASGAISIGAAVHALVRDYAGGPDCLVCSSADSGEVGAALIVKA